MIGIGYIDEDVMKHLDLAKLIAYAEKQPEANRLVSNLDELKERVAAGHIKEDEIPEQIAFNYSTIEEIFEMVVSGTVLSCECDDVGGWYLIYPQKFQWDLLEEEKDLTLDDVKEILIGTIREIANDDFDAVEKLKTLDI